ncbi:MAG: response regulator transcription factor [Pseudomonadota bacterium]|jgi:Response regulator containing a CheY-like receiver domain and an HTH DNA-binding domain|nr:MAG: DNA-binding response regulator [Pseudomonadota bacterium]
MKPMTVLLVDDHAVVREGYRRLLEESGRIAVVGEAASATEALEKFDALKPHVVVMDISLPGVSGIEATRRIRARSPDACVLIFSMHEDAIFARRALDAGARGYVTKSSAPRVLVEAVDAVANGGRYLSHDIAQRLALGGPPGEGESIAMLSTREFEVLKLLAQGLTLAQIAEQLGVAVKTVANHQSAIKQKLGADTGRELVRQAMRLGIIPNV